MNYATQTRIKLWGTIQVINDDKALIESLHDASYKARLERAIIFSIEAWDINCRQHIKQRFTAEEINELTKPLYDRIETLEAQIAQQ